LAFLFKLFDLIAAKDFWLSNLLNLTVSDEGYSRNESYEVN
jgi:hypothetical protein